MDRVKLEKMPPAEEIKRRAHKLVSEVFRGKLPAVGRAPAAIISMGVHGAGKSTAIRKRVPPSFVHIDPDEVMNILLKQGPLPNGGPVYSLSDQWTHHLLDHAIKNRYDFVLDTALPSAKTLRLIKSKGYTLELLLVRAMRSRARDREVRRDLGRGWGRVGLSSTTHRKTRDRISKEGPTMASKYADALTVCDNNGTVMQCMKHPMPLQQASKLFMM